MPGSRLPAVLALAALLARALPARAEGQSPPDVPAAASQPARPAAPERPPGLLRPVMRVISKGLLLRLPIVDTDPNRGVTIGYMPIWVLEDKAKKVRHIHAPSLDYNKTFGVTGTYRYFFYPKPDADLNVRGSLSEVVNRELFLKYEDKSWLGSPAAVFLKARYDKDGSFRFFGIGPATPKPNETNYVNDILGYRAHAGWPVLGRLFLNVGQRLESVRAVDGPVKSIDKLSARFPEQVAEHRHQDLSLRSFLSYDTRDDPDTTTKGVYLEAGAETSQRRLASEYTYKRYNAEARGFLNTPGPRRLVTAARLRFEQVTGGSTPFWLDPQLGGKYGLRAYGEGRFVDRGLFSSSLEQRVLVYSRKIAGVWSELELAPFVEAGTVFPTAPRMSLKWLRPAYGLAIRAVARPQIVGSLDFGYGQEGLASFVDINYSF